MGDQELKKETPQPAATTEDKSAPLASAEAPALRNQMNPGNTPGANAASNPAVPSNDPANQTTKKQSGSENPTETSNKNKNTEVPKAPAADPVLERTRQAAQSEGTRSIPNTTSKKAEGETSPAPTLLKQKEMELRDRNDSKSPTHAFGSSDEVVNSIPKRKEGAPSPDIKQSNPFEGAVVPQKGYRTDKTPLPQTGSPTEPAPTQSKSSSTPQQQPSEQLPKHREVTSESSVSHTGKLIPQEKITSPSKGVQEQPTQPAITQPSNTPKKAVDSPVVPSSPLVGSAKEDKKMPQGDLQNESQQKIIRSAEIKKTEKQERVISQTNFSEQTKKESKVQEVSLPPVSRVETKTEKGKEIPLTPRKEPVSERIEPIKNKDLPPRQEASPQTKSRVVEKQIEPPPQVSVKGKAADSLKERVIIDSQRTNQAEQTRHVNLRLKGTLQETMSVERKPAVSEEVSLQKLRARLITLLLRDQESPQKALIPFILLNAGVSGARGSSGTGSTDASKLQVAAVVRVIEQASNAVKLAVKVLQGIELVENRRAIPPETLVKIKGIIQDLIRSTLPIGNDPDSITPERMEQLRARIMQLLAQAKEELMSLDASGEALEDLIEVLEDLNQLEFLEEQLLEELLLLEDPHSFDEVLLEEHVELFKIVPEKKEDEIEEVYVLSGHVVHKETAMAMANVVVYGGLLGTCITDELGSFAFHNIPAGTMVTIGLDPEFISDPVIFQGVIEAHSTVLFRVMQNIKKERR